MSVRAPSRRAVHALTAGQWVLRPHRARAGRWAILLLVMLGCLAAGSAGGYAFARFSPWATADLDVALAKQRTLQQQIDKAKLDARMSAARTTALEQQIDELSHQLAESQEQLTFFRKAQAGKSR